MSEPALKCENNCAIFTQNYFHSKLFMTFKMYKDSSKPYYRKSGNTA